MSSLGPSPTGVRIRQAAVILVPVLVFVCCSIMFLWFVFFRVQYTISLEPIRTSPGLYESGMLWRRRGLGRWDLVHGFIFKNGTHGSSDTECGWRTRHIRSHNMHKGVEGSIHVTMTPHSLVADGGALVPTPDSRVFVLTSRGKCSAVSLTPDEMSLFHPDVYPECLTNTDLWRNKFREFVDPALVESEKEKAAIAEEERWQADLKKMGIKLTEVHGPFQGELIYYSDFYQYPNGTSQLLTAIFTSNAKVSYGRLASDLQYPLSIHPNPQGGVDEKSMWLVICPSFIAINNKRMDRGKIYVQKPSGEVDSLDLTEEEFRQCTVELLESPDKLKATELYRNKIAPAIGVPLQPDQLP